MSNICEEEFLEPTEYACKSAWHTRAPRDDLYPGQAGPGSHIRHTHCSAVKHRGVAGLGHPMRCTIRLTSYAANSLRGSFPQFIFTREKNIRMIREYECDTGGSWFDSNTMLFPFVFFLFCFFRRNRRTHVYQLRLWPRAVTFELHAGVGRAVRLSRTEQSHPQKDAKFVCAALIHPLCRVYLLTAHTHALPHARAEPSRAMLVQCILYGDRNYV